MNSIVILQARTNSSRLPAKVLLPIGGIPIVVLAAKRAANTGKKVIVATSLESSDDGLVDLLKKNSIDYFRGNLNNTLQRFVDALSTFSDSTIVFRLTADNVFPDGSLLDEIEDDFLNRKFQYLNCNGEASGLPYGTSAEVTYLGNLRDALKNTNQKNDLEHVTPYVIRKFGMENFNRYKNLRAGLYRSTIDTFEDYLTIQKVFSKIENPIIAPLMLLIEELKNNQHLHTSDNLKKLVVGGAQLGLSYGINNIYGKPSITEAQELLKTAIRNSVEYIDTAIAYGNSEQVIGEALSQSWQSRVKIITKLSPLTNLPIDTETDIISKYIESSIYQSCHNLRRHSLDALLLHRASHLDDWNGFVWARLLELKETGLISELGVSVQSPSELNRVLDEQAASFIQLPYNILDWRWESCIERIKKTKEERGLTIHVRSSLLQGLLCSTDIKKWQQANVKDSQSIIDWLEVTATQQQYTDKIDLCLAYVRSQQWIDGIVVGMETKQQLVKNIECFNNKILDEDVKTHIDNTRPLLSENTLNPSLWKIQNP